MRLQFLILAAALQVLPIYQRTAAGKSQSKQAAPKESSKLVIVGTLGSIYQLDEPCLTKCWGLYVHVDKVLVGKYHDATITFAVHSPGRMGLELGATYKIEATWKEDRYVVTEGLWPRWPQK
ncbi:MAG: hypothetical protein WCG85_06185 [Polyangia bacterium]